VIATRVAASGPLAAGNEFLEAPLAMVVQLSVDDLHQWRTEGRPFTLLDVREDEELAIAAITGAQHIPMRTIPARIGEIPTDRPLVVMCHHGMRSQQVAHFLEQSGREQVHNLAGGIHAWSTRIDPTIATY